MSGSLSINLHKPAVFAGESVSGDLLFTVDSPIKISQVYIELEGKTKTQIESGNSKAWSEGKVAYELQQVVSEETVFAVGTCVFPFKFELEEDAPGSVKYGGMHNRASIKYKLKACAKSPGKWFDIDQTVEFDVDKPAPKLIKPCSKAETLNITQLCCLAKGSVDAVVKFEKDAYAEGETVTADIMIDASKCQVNVNEVSLRLKRTILFTASFQRYIDTENIATTFHDKPIQKGETSEFKLSFKVPFSYHKSDASTANITCSYELVLDVHVPMSTAFSMRKSIIIYKNKP